MNDYKDMACLYTVGGDGSRRGVSDKNSVLTVPQEHFELVKVFMRAQLEANIRCYMHLDPASEETKLRSGQYWEAANALIDAGVFKHKYHSRANWELGFFNELLDGCYGDVKTFDFRHVDDDILRLLKFNLPEKSLSPWNEIGMVERYAGLSTESLKRSKSGGAA